jgi:16S rRNA G966 N2-methylase RsmD
MKLSEHYCPNFYDIESSTGTSFKSLWTSTNLEKILRWNRKSHSTPYLSELKRGIYFCCGLTKNTMYRPQMMKLACMKYKPEIVFDPCAGWGGRMLGAVSYGVRYIAFEPNTTTYNNLMNMASFLGIQHKVTLICDDARNMKKYNLPNVDLVLTSPPYFDLEVYTHEQTQSISNTPTYQDWADSFLREIINLSIEHLNDNGTSCWNVGKVKNRDMNIDVLKYHNEFGYDKMDVLNVISSKRQSNQTTTMNSKSSDTTVVYKKSI